MRLVKHQKQLLTNTIPNNYDQAYPHLSRICAAFAPIQHIPIVWRIIINLYRFFVSLN